MKKTLILLLALLLVFSAACTNAPGTPGTAPVPAPSDPGSAFNWGITLTAEHVTPTGMTLVCTQSGGNAQGSLETGSYYALERLTPDGHWVAVEPVIEGELAWTAEAWIIFRNGETRWEISWEWLYGALPGGSYRLGKQITDFRGPGESDKMTVYAEFSIADD